MLTYFTQITFVHVWWGIVFERMMKSITDNQVILVAKEE